jgi:hypothetical protein
MFRNNYRFAKKILTSQRLLYSTLEKYIRFGGLPYLIHLPFDDIVIIEYIRLE